MDKEDQVGALQLSVRLRGVSPPVTRRLLIGEQALSLKVRRESLRRNHTSTDAISSCDKPAAAHRSSCMFRILQRTTWRQKRFKAQGVTTRLSACLISQGKDVVAYSWRYI
jgi:hypothetical protein